MVKKKPKKRDDTYYIFCPRRKNEPRVSVRVCKEKCRYYKNCVVWKGRKEDGKEDK